MEENYKLISMTQYPSMAGPWSSDTAGESYVWEDFLAILQTNSASVERGMMNLMGKGSSQSDQNMLYPFALTVFYKKHKNPHGPSSRPVLSIGIEKINPNSAQVKAIGMNTKETPIMIVVFNADLRLNMGDFKGELSAENAKKALFPIMGKQLGLLGDPVYIGTIDDARGHPETGFEEKTKKQSGCLSVIAFFLAIVSTLYFGIDMLVT